MTILAIKVALAQDDLIVRAAIAMLIAQEADLEVVGQMRQTGDLPAALADLRAGVLLLPLDGDWWGLLKIVEAIRVRCSELPIVALSNLELKTCIVSLLDAGVAGYVLKNDPPEMLGRAVRAVTRGERWLSPRTVDILVKAAGRSRRLAPDDLTAREIEVLRLMAVGYRNGQIADLLHVTEQTIKNHIGSIYGKLSVKTRVKAVLQAIHLGLVPLEP